MQMITLAAWLLRVVMERQRAEGVLGDLLEGSNSRGLFWFWRSIGGIMLLSMRSTFLRIGTAFALGSLGMRFGLLILPWQRRFLEKAVSSEVQSGSLLATAIMLGILTVPWFLLPYSLIRGGVRDRLAWLSGSICLVSLVLWPLLMSPAYVERYLLEATLVLIFLAIKGSWRDATATLSLSALTYSSLFALFNVLQMNLDVSNAHTTIGPVLLIRIDDIALPLLLLGLVSKLYPTRALA